MYSDGHLDSDMGNGCRGACARVADILPSEAGNERAITVPGRRGCTGRIRAIEAHQARKWDEVRRTGTDDALADISGSWK